NTSWPRDWSSDVCSSDLCKSTDSSEMSSGLAYFTITHVVTEFLKYAKPLDISDESVDLQPLVERVIGELQEAIPGVKVTAEGRFGQVSGDEGLLRQAILNIARNAAEAASDAPGTGRVFSLGSVEAIGNNEVQQIRVVDSGPGIS